MWVRETVSADRTASRPPSCRLIEMNTRHARLLPRTCSSVRRARSRQASTAPMTWTGTMIAASNRFCLIVMASL
jgi:hypothetical protein